MGSGEKTAKGEKPKEADEKTGREEQVSRL